MEEVVEYTHNIVKDIGNDKERYKLASISSENHRSYGNKASVGICPRCGRDVIEFPKSFSCVGFSENPKCEFTIWKENRLMATAKKKVTTDMARHLLNKKEVLVSGLIAKSGKSYDGYFKLEDDGKSTPKVTLVIGKKPPKKRNKKTRG